MIRDVFAKVKCNNWAKKDVWDDQGNLLQDYELETCYFYLLLSSPFETVIILI